MKNFIKEIFGFIICIIILFILFIVNDNNNHLRIENWAQRHGYVAKNIENWAFTSPFPFWRRKNDDIYQADLLRDNKVRVSYFKCSGWGVSQKWEDGTSADENEIY